MHLQLNSCNSIKNSYILWVKIPVLWPPLLLDKLKCALDREANGKQRIHLPIPWCGWEEDPSVERQEQQCEWHQVILLPHSHLPDRIVLCPDKRLSEAAAFLSLPYLMIDGSIATWNLPFLNNLYCHRYGQLAYNRVVIFPLTGWDQYFKDLRYPLMNYLTGSLGCKTIALFTQSQEKGDNIKCLFSGYCQELEEGKQSRKSREFNR